MPGITIFSAGESSARSGGRPRIVPLIDSGTRRRATGKRRSFCGSAPASRPGRRWLAWLLLTVCSTGVLVAQQADVDPVEPPWKSSDLPMDSLLHRASLLVEGSRTEAEWRTPLSDLGLRLDAAGRIRVEISGPMRPDTPLEGSLPPDARVGSSWRGRYEAWIPPPSLTATAKALPPGYFMSVPPPPAPSSVIGEGPQATGSAEHRDRGLVGEGLTVAVIDLCYERLSEARANGDVPDSSRSEEINLVADGFEDHIEDCGVHGTACTEAVYDHLPGARYRLYKIANGIDLGNAIDDAIAHGTDIVSLSVNWFNTGWNDDSGLVCEAVDEAAGAGALVFTASGNYARSHWQGPFDPGPDSDNTHDWVPGDETIDVRVYPRRRVNVALSWDKSGGTHDLDLYLLDDDRKTVLADSTNQGNNYEWLTWKNRTDEDRTVHVSVKRRSGGAVEMEVFLYRGGAWLEHAVAESSTTSPSNATHPNVISVGAVPWDEFAAPAGTTDIVRQYSSQGPTNSGMVAPDLSGPTGVTGFSYTNPFEGTSSSTPGAAGTAGVLWSCSSTTPASAVRDRLFDWAENFRDWGAPGADSVYGHGGIGLPPYQDCNANAADDACDLLLATSSDCDGDSTPDDCQPDGDQDGVIDVCDNCQDSDHDGYGSPGDPSCLLGSETDCDDADASHSPATIEICDGQDTDCSGVADDRVCRGFDLDHDGRIDGLELAWLARSFGYCSSGFLGEWWGPADYDRDACIDGDDLAILASKGVWSTTTLDCSFTCP